jgi:hypothetical protein
MSAEKMHSHLKERWRPANSENLPGGSPHFKSFEQYWNHYVPNHLLPRLHAYELMMAPYAIAHMKIGLKLAELFGKAKGTISEHIKHIFEDGELEEISVVRLFRTTASDGKNYEV